MPWRMFHLKPRSNLKAVGFFRARPRLLSLHQGGFRKNGGARSDFLRSALKSEHVAPFLARVPFVLLPASSHQAFLRGRGTYRGERLPESQAWMTRSGSRRVLLKCPSSISPTKNHGTVYHHPATCPKLLRLAWFPGRGVGAFCICSGLRPGVEAAHLGQTIWVWLNFIQLGRSCVSLCSEKPRCHFGHHFLSHGNN